MERKRVKKPGDGIIPSAELLFTLDTYERKMNINSPTSLVRRKKTTVKLTPPLHRHILANDMMKTY